MTRNWWLSGFCGVAVLVLVASSGCSDTDPLSNGNVQVAIEVFTEGSTVESFECTLWTIASLNIRPLDGECSGGPSDGAPCFNDTDCVPGICADAQAQDVVGANGVFIVTGPKGNLDGSTCEATLDSGFGECTWECQPDAGDPPCPFFPKPCDINNPSPETTCDPLIVDPDDNPNSCVPRYSFEANAGAFVPPEPMILSAGLYEIINLSVGPTGLYNDTPEGGGEPNLKWCADEIEVDELYDTEDLRFRVVDGETTLLRFVVNLDALEGALPDDSECDGFEADIVNILEIRSVP